MDYNKYRKFTKFCNVTCKKVQDILFYETLRKAMLKKLEKITITLLTNNSNIGLVINPLQSFKTKGNIYD